MHKSMSFYSQVLACSMLKRLPEFRDADIVRSRDPAVLDECDIVVDVGGVYDHGKKRYDHHQKTFSDTMKTLVQGKEWETKLSSGKCWSYNMTICSTVNYMHVLKNW